MQSLVESKQVLPGGTQAREERKNPPGENNTPCSGDFSARLAARSDGGASWRHWFDYMNLAAGAFPLDLIK